MNVVVVAARSGSRDWYCSCNCYNGWGKEYVTATTRRWKVSLVQDHEDVVVNGIVVVTRKMALLQDHVKGDCYCSSTIATATARTTATAITETVVTVVTMNVVIGCNNDCYNQL